MKLTTLVVSLFAACTLIQAAENPNPILKLHFDSPVLVGEVQIPAGDVAIQLLPNSVGNVVLSVRSESGISVAVLANRITPESEHEKAGVILDRTANGYTLARVWINDQNGFELLRSSTH